VKDLNAEIAVGKQYLKLRFTKRKTLSIAVLPDLSILVTAPCGTEASLIEEKLKKREGWIKAQLDFFAKPRSFFTEKKYISGESHLYLGRQYRLKLHKLDDASPKLIKAGTYLHVYSDDLSQEVISQTLESWYRSQAEKYFSRILLDSFKKFCRHYTNFVMDFNSRLTSTDAGYVSLKSVEFPRLFVRKMKTRWGSLSLKANLTLNLELIKAPPECIEYVIFHELCHLVHHNHSKEFFLLLNRILPDAAKLKDKLENFSA
jgi:predicted metal-dependent hydrolase